MSGTRLAGEIADARKGIRTPPHGGVFRLRGKPVYVGGTIPSTPSRKISSDVTSRPTIQS
jgi:hypothetical protein